MLHLFQEAGWGIMSLLTINLVVLIVAIWKAPRLIKNLGLLPWGYTLCYKAIDLIQGFDQIQAVGAISQGALLGGFKVVLIPIVYAAFIYTISIVADMIVAKKK